MIGEHSLVVFTRLKNSRGYPLTGKVIDTDGKFAIVRAYGLDGPGSITEINNVPLDELYEDPPYVLPTLPPEPDDAP